MIKAFRNTRREHWRETVWELLFAVLGGLFPLWAGALILVLVSRDLPGSLFIDAGQFALYSAAMLSPVLFLLAKDSISSGRLTSRGFAGRPGFVASSVIFLLISAVVFTAVIISATSLEDEFTINTALLRIITILTYLISVTIALLAGVIDKSQMYVDFEAASNTSVDHLGKQFDRVEGGQK